MDHRQFKLDIRSPDGTGRVVGSFYLGDIRSTSVSEAFSLARKVLLAGLPRWDGHTVTIVLCRQGEDEATCPTWMSFIDGPVSRMEFV